MVISTTPERAKAEQKPSPKGGGRARGYAKKDRSLAKSAELDQDIE